MFIHTLFILKAPNYDALSFFLKKRPKNTKNDECMRTFPRRLCILAFLDGLVSVEAYMVWWKKIALTCVHACLHLRWFAMYTSIISCDSRFSKNNKKMLNVCNVYTYEDKIPPGWIYVCSGMHRSMSTNRPWTYACVHAYAFVSRVCMYDVLVCVFLCDKLDPKP